MAKDSTTCKLPLAMPWINVFAGVWSIRLPGIGVQVNAIETSRFEEISVCSVCHSSHRLFIGTMVQRQVMMQVMLVSNGGTDLEDTDCPLPGTG